MKAIVIGTSLSGKTTLIRHLRTFSDFPITEMDEELTAINGGNFPTDAEHKHNVLAPKVIDDILDRETVLFFTNTDYFTDKDLKRAHENGFMIIQLHLDLDSLKKRNQQRVENEGYSDLSEWLEGMVSYQKHIQDSGFIDQIIEMDQPVEVIAEQLLKILKSQTE